MKQHGTAKMHPGTKALFPAEPPGPEFGATVPALGLNPERLNCIPRAVASQRLGSVTEKRPLSQTEETSAKPQTIHTFPVDGPRPDRDSFYYSQTLPMKHKGV